MPLPVVFLLGLSGMAAGLPRPPFPLGGATAAYQVEGAAHRGGRGPSIWDTFTKIPGRVAHNDTGDVADDFYDKYLDDIATAKALNMRMFRLSISWSRVLPDGTGRVNREGLDFYSRVVDALLDAGIQPHVTLYHWDLPQALEDRWRGWLGRETAAAFEEFARLVFRELGPRVSHWTTFNEMQSFVQKGYISGRFAPGRCSDRARCGAGDSRAEPWLALHNVLLAHGLAAAQLRRLHPRALLSCNFNIVWPVPLTDAPADQAAAQRYMDWHVGVYADPLFFGSLPASVAAANISALSFTSEERRLLRGSVDYFALNHYTSYYVTSWDNTTDFANEPQEINVEGDPHDPAGVDGRTGNTIAYAARNGSAIGQAAESGWLYVYPEGLRQTLRYVHEKYGAVPIYITENGVSVPNESALPLSTALHDTFRMEYYKGYIQQAIKAVHEDNITLAGYFAWSLLDNFEWLDGYETRFGLLHVDFSSLTRYVKDSGRLLADWFKDSSSCGQGGCNPWPSA